MSSTPFGTVGIVGLGLIGGSVALAARATWPSLRIVAVDRRAVLDDARAAGAIDAGTETLDAAAEADLVVLAAPVRQNLELLPQLPGRVKRTAVVTDVGSTKRDIVEVAAALPDGVTFVAGHPIAGAAVGGFANAQADLFRNRPWLFTPSERTDPAAVSALSSFVAALGAEPGVMTLAEHDRVFAYVSHLPQLVVSALMSVAGGAVGGGGLALSGRGLLDTTRLASSPSDIWRDVAAVNADQIGPALDSLIAVLQRLRDDLPTGRYLTDLFADAARWRDELVQRSQL
ncbi:MAG: prephenate dehydrogenase [Vicinamibacterales bacterium]